MRPRAIVASLTLALLLLQGGIAHASLGLETVVAFNPVAGEFPEGLALDKNAAIPIHVLIDPDGALRCVRVGSAVGSGRRREQRWRGPQPR